MDTIRTTSLTFTNSTFCPHSVFICFVWISEQTAIISLCSIKWLVFSNIEGMCLLRGTNWMFRYNAGHFPTLKCQIMCRCMLDCPLFFFVSETTRWISAIFGTRLYSKNCWSQIVCYLFTKSWNFSPKPSMTRSGSSIQRHWVRRVLRNTAFILNDKNIQNFQGVL